jgi:hypothetical protein
MRQVIALMRKVALAKSQRFHALLCIAGTGFHTRSATRRSACPRTNRLREMEVASIDIA